MNLYLFKSCENTICSDSYSILANRIKQISRVFESVDKSLIGKEINIILSDKNSIQGLNKTFRKADRPTDILTFPLDSQIFGEIWLCPEVIDENAKKFREKYEIELLRITIHGLLHLSGYDHKGYFVKDDKQSEKIFELQEKILEMLY